MAEKTETITLTVESITARGKYSTVKAGETYYNVWDLLVLEKLIVGETYSAKVTSKDSTDKNTGLTKTFHNIIEASPASEIDFAAQFDSLVGTTPIPKPIPKKDISMSPLDFMIDVRKTALNNAVAMLVGGSITIKAMNQTLTKFEKYIVSGLPVEQNSNTPVSESLNLDEFVA